MCNELLYSVRRQFQTANVVILRLSNTFELYFVFTVLWKIYPFANAS